MAMTFADLAKRSLTERQSVVTRVSPPAPMPAAKPNAVPTPASSPAPAADNGAPARPPNPFAARVAAARAAFNAGPPAKSTPTAVVTREAAPRPGPPGPARTAGGSATPAAASAALRPAPEVPSTAETPPSPAPASGTVAPGAALRSTPPPPAVQKESKASQKTAAAGNTPLGRLGLQNPAEALLCLPAKFVDLRNVDRRIYGDSDKVSMLYALRFTGDVNGYDKAKKPVKNPLKPANWTNIKRMEVLLEDELGQRVTWSMFGSYGVLKELTAGELVVLAGKVTWLGYENPKAYLSDVETAPAWAIGKIWVRYTGIAGRIAGEVVEGLVRAQVDNPDAYEICAAKVCEALGVDDAGVVEAMGGRFSSCVALLKALHTPATVEEGDEARRLAITIATRCVQAAALRHNVRRPHERAPIEVREHHLRALASLQPESLTEDQQRVATAIAGRLRSETPLNALVTGDVGTGKTLAYLLPIIAAHRAGARVMIMAPTTILADQIAGQIAKRFGSVIRGVQFLDSKTRARKAPPDLDHILVGTSGVASFATKHGYIPNVLVCDEQHKLSAAARESLIHPWTHYIEVTATPIPRSMATAMFGGKEVLTLTQCPVTKTFENHLGDVAQRPEYLAVLRQVVREGGRAAVVYPRVQDQRSDAQGEDEGKKPDRAKSSVLQGARLLKEVFPGQVAVLHGDMSDTEVLDTVAKVRDGTYPVVIASTLLETGIDIASMRAMIVRDADHFGTAQLHQLRGRLARDGGVGRFMMLVESLDALEEATLQRLRSVQSCNDGFELAERDLQLRGFGDLAGGAQSGATSNSVFKLVTLRPDDYVRKRVVAGDGLAAQALEQLAETEITPYGPDEDTDADSRERRQPGLFQ